MESAWPEVETAAREGRREVKLAGGEVARRVAADGLPDAMFDLPLNLLTVADTQLERLPDRVGDMRTLRSLLAFNNRLVEFPKGALVLKELSVLDLSRNRLSSVPQEVKNLTNLTALNLSSNAIESFPGCTLPKLATLDLSHNELVAFPDVCRPENTHLADFRLNSNKITDIPAEVNVLPSLKNFDLADNLIKFVPKELSEIPRLKDINLKGNKLNDNRLLKLVDQCRSKQIIDYIRQNCPKAGSAEQNSSGKISKKNVKKQQQRKNEQREDGDSEDRAESLCDMMQVLHFKDETPNIKINDSIKNVRPHIICCIVHGLSFTEESFKKFIQMQTKLHDTICEKRNAATIATHDFNKLPPGDLLYSAKPPYSINIQPLNRTKMYSGLELYTQLRKEAEDLRKEKKRNVYSGIHKYLYLLEGKNLYPCLEDSKNNAISFPPITNSDITKMSHESTSMLAEVTSSLNQTTCRKVMDAFLLETLNMGVGGRADGNDQEVNNRLGTYHKLQIQQMRVVDLEGKMKVIYPSKVDLFYEDNKNQLKIIRE